MMKCEDQQQLKMINNEREKTTSMTTTTTTTKTTMMAIARAAKEKERRKKEARRTALTQPLVCRRYVSWWSKTMKWTREWDTLTHTHTEETKMKQNVSNGMESNRISRQLLLKEGNNNTNYLWTLLLLQRFITFGSRFSFSLSFCWYLCLWMFYF